MDRDGMERMVKVGDQWLSLEAYRAMKAKAPTSGDILLLLAVMIAGIILFYRIVKPGILLILKAAG